MTTYILNQTRKNIKKLKVKVFRLQADAERATGEEYNTIIDELRESRQELNRLNDFFDNEIKKLSRYKYVENCIYLHYAKGYSWKKIAIDIGGGNTEDSVRKMCSRYVW